MTDVLTSTPIAPDGEPPAPPRRVRTVVGIGDQVFRQGVRSAGIAVLVITGSIGLFLFLRAFVALKAAGFKFLTTQQWQPSIRKFGIAAVLPGTIAIALVAVVVSTPLAIGAALFISEIAPGRIKRALIAGVDLMFAVPSVVFGLWGLEFFQQHVVGVSQWIATYFGWVPFLHVAGFHPSNPLASRSLFSASTFIAGLVVALMIAPIQCSLMREVFSQAPPGEREGALALGATRWGMIRTVVLPYGRGGMIGATMLALGRALGETVAVYLIISPAAHLQLHILQHGAISVSALIANLYSEASAFGLAALFAAGMALFALTMALNFTAATIIGRSRSGALSDA